MKKALIMLTRGPIGKKVVSEYEQYWKEMNFADRTEKVKKDEELIGKKASKGRNILIVLDGREIQSPGYSGGSLGENDRNFCQKFVTVICDQIEKLHNSDKVALGIHWHDMRADRIFQFFSNIFEAFETLRIKKPVFERAHILPYNIGVGGTNAIIVSQIKEIVSSLQSNFAGFEEAFENLWGALKSSHKINFLLQTLLSRLKIEWYDIGKDQSSLNDNSEAKKIVNAFWYLLKGKLMGGYDLPDSEGEVKKEVIASAIDILPPSDAVWRNVEKFIISDFSWKNAASEELEDHLKELDKFYYGEDFKRNNFISRCVDFSQFLSSITAGKRPGIDDGSKSPNQ